MANPQLENGHTRIANEIIEALWKVNLSPYESRLLWYLLRKTYGWNKKTDRIALSQFSKDIGIDRRLVHRTIKKLSSKRMIVLHRDDKNTITYGFQKDHEKWKALSKEMGVIPKDDEASSKKMTEVSSIEIPTIEKKKTIQKKEETTRNKNKTGVPKSFPLTSLMIEWARAQGCIGDLQKITDTFLDYHGAKGNKFVDWNRAWKNWIRKDIEFKNYDVYQFNKKEITMDNVKDLYEN